MAEVMVQMMTVAAVVAMVDYVRALVVKDASINKKYHGCIAYN